MSSEIVNCEIFSSLHDAGLVGLTYESNHEIRLDFARDEEKNITIMLKGVTKFVANNLLDGNIALDVYSTKFKRLSIESMSDIVCKAFSDDFITITEELALASNHRLNRLLNQILTGELQLFVVEPSYGAEVVAICSSVDICSTK